MGVTFALSPLAHACDVFCNDLQRRIMEIDNTPGKNTNKCLWKPIASATLMNTLQR